MPDVAELLDTWEAGLAAREQHRTLLLHALARPGAALDRLRAVPVGERDADLCGLRRYLFGDELALRVACRACGAELEFALAARDLVAAAPSIDGAAVHELTDGEWAVRFRLPTVADLDAASEAGPDAARRVLLARCVVSARWGGRAVDADELPMEVQERMAERATEADPRADIRLNLPCPECGAQTKAVLDIGSALWQELDAWARGTLRDVYLLASSCGWSEAEVLAMSPLRRRYYLKLAGHA